MSKEASLRRISIRSVRRSPPDLSKLGRALIQLAMAQAESEARTQKHSEQSVAHDFGRTDTENDSEKTP